jgi:radical SAM superfamily enzyme YgiQ (UPF0313 family)
MSAFESWRSRRMSGPLSEATPSSAPGHWGEADPARVVLVDNFFSQRVGDRTPVPIVPHLGLMSLAAVLEGSGHNVEILDPKILFVGGRWATPDGRFLRAVAENLLDRAADVIGFTAYGRSLPFAVKVARELKAIGVAAPILLGGPHPTILGPMILESFTCFDVVVRYEAERVILPLVEALRAGSDLGSIPNLVIRRDGQVVATPLEIEPPEMDDLPRPSLHLYPIEALRLADLAIEAGRGCPFACTFCSTATFFRRRYRLKSNLQMVEEMEAIRRTYGVASFDLNHDLFGLVRRSVLEFCALVEGRGFSWRCSMRPDTVDGPLIEALALAGCSHLYFGIETGSPRLQGVIKKRLDLAETRRTLRLVHDAGIAFTASFITGFPEETETDQDETLDMIGELLALSPDRVKLQLHVLSPEPGSALADRAGYRVTFDGIGPEADELLDDELIRDHPEIFSVFHHFESVVPRWRSLLASIFVMRLIPELGLPATAHLTHVAFEGRLSRLFLAVTGAGPHPRQDFEASRALLHRGVDDVLASLPAHLAYLRDLVRLSRALQWLDDPPADARLPSGSLGDGGSRAWEVVVVARFDHDVTALARDILRDPTRVPTGRAAATSEYWCLLYQDAFGNPCVAGVSPREGRRLVTLASPRRAKDFPEGVGPVLLTADSVAAALTLRV